MSYIRKILIFFRGIRNSNNNLIKHNFVKVGNNSSIKNVNVELRNPITRKCYFFIGSNCEINGNYIFETTSGKIKIGDRTFIGGGTFICIEEIEIGNDVMFAWGCTVIDNDAHSLIWDERKNDVLDWRKGLSENKIGKYKNWDCVKREKITIKDKAWIGFNSIILKGVTIGEGAVVAAGSVVTRSVPDFTLVAGNPAKIIKKLK